VQPERLKARVYVYIYICRVWSYIYIYIRTRQGIRYIGIYIHTIYIYIVSAWSGPRQGPSQTTHVLETCTYLNAGNRPVCVVSSTLECDFSILGQNSGAGTECLDSRPQDKLMRSANWQPISPHRHHLATTAQTTRQPRNESFLRGAASADRSHGTYW